MAIGDVDGDQVPDLAVANWYSDNVSVLLGLGDGMFAAAVHYDTGDEPSSVVIGDLDNDEVPDLVVTNYGFLGSGDVSVLFGVGDGTFAAAVHYAAGIGPVSAAIDDLDSDDVPDLIVVNNGTYPTHFGTVSVLLGAGDGTFAAAVSYPSGADSFSVALGDLDGDQVPDLAVANSGSGNISVLLGVGDGTFPAALEYTADNRPVFVAISDLNGDQVPDLAVTNNGFADSGSVSVLLGIGDGMFAAAVHYTADERPTSVAIADVNGDPVPDLAVANGDSDNVSVLLGVGDGTFAPAVQYGAGNRPSSVVIGDLNGDQAPDLVVANRDSHNVSVLLGLSDGTFAAAVHYATGYRPLSVAIADLNGDEVPDLVVVNLGFTGTSDVSVLLGVGDGSFAAAVNYIAGNYPTSVSIADLNNDQALDLAVANSDDDNVSVLLGVGDGTFSAAVHYAAGNMPVSVGIGYFDGDQVLDLVVLNYLSDNISVLFGVGDGMFAAAEDYFAGYFPDSMAIGNLDGDDMPDLVAVSGWGDNVWVLLNQWSPTLGDIDGDGDVDPFDLALLLGSWGPCPDPDDCPADLDGDGNVGAADLAMLLGNWG